jgi:hypothetical protein
VAADADQLITVGCVASDGYDEAGGRDECGQILRMLDHENPLG